MKEFSHKDEWRLSSKDFVVTVTRHTSIVAPDHKIDDRGPNRWAVYAYIYPEHKLYAEFVGNSIFQPATSKLPFHGGPSFLKFHYNSTGDRQSIQVGADYNHLYDEEFSFYATKDEAYQVFNDAIELFEHLSK